MSDFPQVSVIMPVYNGAAFLPASLASIQRQNQPGLELVLIDDGSTDNSADVIRRLAPEASYHYQENGGCSAARNTGLARARAPLIAFLDMDDEWPEGNLRHLGAALEEHPQALFALGRTRFLSRTNAPMPEPWVSTNLGAGLYRREVFAQVGTFNPSRTLTDDVEWFIRAREKKVSYVTVEHVTLNYWRRPGSMTHGLDWGKTDLMATIRNSLARRRLAGGGQAAELNLLSGSKIDPRASGAVKHEN